MRIYIVGVACVGKSTIGKILSEKLGYSFVDFDLEIQERMGETISELKDRHFNEHGFRDEVSYILSDLLKEYKDNVVIAMPPSGMYGQYLRILKKNTDVLTITLKDKAKNILERTIFFDEDNNLLEDVITDKNRYFYYESIKDDIEYFYTTHRKTKMKFDINGLSAEESAEGLLCEIKENYLNVEK